MAKVAIATDHAIQIFNDLHLIKPLEMLQCIAFITYLDAALY
jgi:hypothetical protein